MRLPSSRPHPLPRTAAVLRSLIQLILTMAVVLIVSDYFTPSAFAEASPEYLKAQNATEVDLKDSHSATESIGQLPAHPSNQYDPLVDMNLHQTKKDHSTTASPFFGDLMWAINPRFYYFHRDTENQGIEESAAIGGSLGLETGWFKDTFRFGLTGYTSQKVYGPKDRDGAGLLAPGQKGYSVLGEAYIDIKHREISLRAGRTRVDLPYINGDDFRMTPNTFEAVGLRSKAHQYFKWGVGHFGSYKGNTDTQFKSMSEAAGVKNADRGVSVVSLRYEFTEEDFIALSEQYGWDMYNTLYLEGEKYVEFSDRLKLRLGAQFTDQRSVGDELLGNFSTHTMGLKASVQYCNITGSLSYTKTGMSRQPFKPWGATPSYNSKIVKDFDRAGEDAFHLGITYDFEPHGIEGLTLDTSWTTGNTPDDGQYASPDQQEFDCTLDYQPPIDDLDGLWLRFRYADVNMEGSNDIEDFRVIVNYSYIF